MVSIYVLIVVVAGSCCLFVAVVVGPKSPCVHTRLA